MPSEIFFRLSAVKQQYIIDAIKAEVARVPYEEFSIYNVVHQCGISRGSFYQYFSNKEDIFLYLFSTYNKNIMNCVITSLKENDGDFFKAIEDGFRFAVRMLCYKDSKIYRQHLFCNMFFYEKLWRDNDFSVEKYPVLHETLLLINQDRLCLQSPDDMKTLIEICTASIVRECITVLLTNVSEEIICESFMRKLNFLKRAYQKKEFLES